MNIYLTTDQRIDRAGKHIMTPAAFADYVTAVTWTSHAVPEVAFTPDPSAFVLPVGYHYAFIEYPLGELDAFRVYYFVEPAAPFEPHVQTNEWRDTVYARYDLRVDWPHTLGMGSLNWSTLLSSHITRSRILPFVNGQYENVRDQPTARYFPAIGQTDEYVTISLWVIEEQGSPVLLEKNYQYVLGVTRRGASQGGDTFIQALGIVQSYAENRVLTRYATAEAQGENVPATLVSAWIVPAAYVPSTTWATAYPRYVPGYYNYWFHPVYLDAAQSVSVTLSGVDMARRTYAIGNGSLDVQLPQTSNAVNSPTVNTYINPITGFKITTTIEGETYDLTNYCLVPYSIIDRSAVSAQNQQRLLAAASTAISIGVGVVSQNPVAVAGGIINGARQQIASPTNAPAKSSGGDCFTQFDGSTYALLRLKSYYLAADSRVANVTRGPMGALPVPSARAIPDRLVDLAALGCIYVEGDIHHIYTGTGPEAPIFSGFEDRMADAYADGVYFWTSAAGYRGAMPT